MKKSVKRKSHIHRYKIKIGSKCEKIAEKQRKTLSEDLKDIKVVFSRVLKNLKKFPDIHQRVKIAKVEMSFEDLPSRIKGRKYEKNGKIYVEVDNDYRGTYCAIGILLHEMIHAIEGRKKKGTELDAEFFENECCSEREGAELPTEGDYEKFEEDGAQIVNIIDEDYDNYRVEVEYVYLNKKKKPKSRTFEL